MIEINDLVVKYGNDTVLDHLNLQIDHNESVAIIGPSGCGKSTLLYALAGLINPQSGEIKINGKLLTGTRKETGVILQSYGLLPWKSVWDNAQLGLQLRKLDRAVIDKKVTKTLQQLQIEDQKNKYPVQLSGGQQQRVAIARALAIDPDLLLMDEPFSSLDAIVREQLQHVIGKLYQESKRSIVFVTHSIEEAVFLGQKIIIMQPKLGIIKQIIDNRHFGDEAFRNSQHFHRMCVHVRQLMEGSC